MTPLKIAGLIAVATSLAGCVEFSTTETTETTLLRTAPATDEAACLTAVAAQTDNSVRVLSSETSEANNLVMVGVGPESAPWKCLVKDGIVAEAYFTGSEGYL